MLDVSRMIKRAVEDCKQAEKAVKHGEQHHSIHEDINLKRKATKHFSAACPDQAS